MFMNISGQVLYTSHRPHVSYGTNGTNGTYGFVILGVECTRPGACEPRVSSTVTRFSRRYIVTRLPSVVPCSASSTCAGLPVSTATSSAVVYWHHSPVPRRLGWVTTTFF